MSRNRIFTSLLVLVTLFSTISVAPAIAQTTGPVPYNRLISSSGTTSMQAAPEIQIDGVQFPEIAGAGGETGMPGYEGNIVNRSQTNGNGKGVSVNSGKKAKSNPQLKNSFDGLNFRQQRLANGGNQFSVEPPDQGLCVGNGYVLETVNDVLRVFDTAGNPLIGVVDLNSFYKYPAAIDRRTGARGPFVTDPSCLYDPDVQRWFHVVLTLDQTTSGALIGTNHLDIAVSKTPDPTGEWYIYNIAVENNGQNGTPDHGCSYGYCIGDYPHIGADAYGFYITTNEYSLFGPEYKSANIYAMSKRQLASGQMANIVQYETVGLAGGNPGFTVWPALSPAGQYATANGGMEYFLSSDAADEANNFDHVSNRIWQWSFSNTSSLDSISPNLTLSVTSMRVQSYAVPGKANQKAGDFPQGQCLNDPTCAPFLLGAPDPYTEVESPLDASDSRMQQVFYANGKLWSSLGSAVTIGGSNQAGIAYFIVNPATKKVVKNGFLALANNHLTYPAVAVTPSGRGVIAFTLVGNDYYPSAGYASLDAVYGAGAIHIAALGVGPQDGFTGYKAQVGDPPRPRWGDYGAAVVDGSSIWIASEYIAQTCTLEQYRSTPFGSCGGTRTALGNWATRITKVTP